MNEQLPAEPAYPATSPELVTREALPSADPTTGGETACWAHLVCTECGAMLSEGHRQDCGLSQAKP